MTDCRHTRIESCEQHDDDMHCSGWRCSDCDQEIVGECHHRTWCRPDFCGAEPIRLDTCHLERGDLRRPV
jgi:hypothetical protein